MKMLQIFETTIFSDTTDHAVRALVAPARSFVDPGDLQSTTEKLIRELDLKKLGPVSPTNLAFALKAMVGVDESDVESSERLFEFLRAQTVTITHATQPYDVAFAEHAAFSRLIPFEQSPLNLESLAELVTSATGVGMGAYAGFVMAAGTPLIFVTVPAGMIIFGAAAGVAKALEEGLRERLLNLLKGKSAKADHGKAAGPKAAKQKSIEQPGQAVEYDKAR